MKPTTMKPVILDVSEYEETDQKEYETHVKAHTTEANEKGDAAATTKKKMDKSLEELVPEEEPGC